jgi:hypothetical protein
LKDNVYTSNPWTGLKENTCRETANISAEQLQKVNQNLLHLWRMSMCRRTAFSALPVICEYNFFIPNIISHHRVNDSVAKFIFTSQLAVQWLMWSGQ